MSDKESMDPIQQQESQFQNHSQNKPLFIMYTNNLSYPSSHIYEANKNRLYSLSTANDIQLFLNRFEAKHTSMLGHQY